MPKATPLWKIKMPEFLGAIAGATEKNDIRMACEEIKEIVVGSYPETPNSRRKPMGEIRKAIRERFPVQEGKSEHESVPFPYFFAENGTGKVKRWEHLAIKYLDEDWNTKQDWSNVEVAAPEVVKPEVVKPEVVKSEVVKPEVVKSELVKSEVVKSEVAKSEVAAPEVVKSKIDILNEVGLNDYEIEAVKNAIGESDIKEWVKQAIMQRTNAINNKREVMDEDVTEVSSPTLMHEKKYRTNPTAVRELVSRAVRVVKRWNLDHPDQKWCITNKLIGEMTGVTVKAIAKAVEGMELEGYNKHHNLSPVVNRLIKESVGKVSENMSIAKVTGIEGTEVDYQP